MDNKKYFSGGDLSQEEINYLSELAHLSRGDILTMTTLAKSGHPGGSMSCIDVLHVIYAYTRVFPNDPDRVNRDRIVISNGHVSPAVYSVLGRNQFFDLNEAISLFRKTGSIYEGHVERCIPGIEWTTGNLGQGLPAGCGFALAGKLKGIDYHVFVMMGDGEQQKGQITEARRFAVKYGLTNVTVIIDMNLLQICGNINEVMPNNIFGAYEADGWEVLEVNGHDYNEVFKALSCAVAHKDKPVVILAHTVMGKGVSFMENQAEFHGKALTKEQYICAMEELGLENKLDYYEDRRTRFNPSCDKEHSIPEHPMLALTIPQPITYELDTMMDNRSAFGKALEDIEKANSKSSPIVVLDCDLMDSVKTNFFASVSPHRFFECGIQEHTTAVIAGALSVEDFAVFFSDFGVFGVDEVYNQHRLNDINAAHVKLICTHLGIDVGEDGKTHHCIDYVGIMRNLYGFKIIIPADANQTDRVIRYIANERGNFFVGMGRSKCPIITDEEGTPFFGGSYKFQYGKADIVRNGIDGVIISMGSMLHRALKAARAMDEDGYKVGVINMSCPSHPDIEVILEGAGTGNILTCEDHNVNTGIGNIIAEIIALHGVSVNLKKVGLRSYSCSGPSSELYEKEGLSWSSIQETMRRCIDGGHTQ